MLGRLGVGANLTLLVLLPVGVLLGFTIAASLDNWRSASSVRSFQQATQQSFVVTDLATALANERTAAALTILHPDDPTRKRLQAAQRDVDTALRQASANAGTWTGPVDLLGRLDAARRQLNAVRVEVTSDSLTAPHSADTYSSIVRNLLATARQLDLHAPTQPSTRAAAAYLAIVEAIEAAAHEQVDVAALLARSTPDPLEAANTVSWSVLEAAQLDVFRENTTGALAADLQVAQSSRAGVAVTAMRDNLRSALNALPQPSPPAWLDASGARIASLRELQTGARHDLAAIASDDLSAAQENGLRGLGISQAVLLLVTGMALALRRSVTRPLHEVAEGARSLSSGDLRFDIGYSGRDEIGALASAFRKMHSTVERLTEEIRGMGAAVRNNRLGHRADVTAFDGTWSQLLAGLNDTMTAFSEAEGRRERAERELADFFQLSLDLLCIADFDGYFTRVNDFRTHVWLYDPRSHDKRPTYAH